MSNPPAPSAAEASARTQADLFELPPAGPAPAELTPETGEQEPPRRSWRAELQEVDWDVVRSLLGREALLTLRSRAWARLLVWFAFGTSLLALLPLLYRMTPGHWHRPANHGWLIIWTLGTALALLSAVSGWTRRRISRELRAGSLEEIMLTGSGPADILLGKAGATVWMATLLVFVTLPAGLLATAVGGRGLDALFRIALTLGFSAYLGLCLGLEYSFRQPGSRSTFSSMWSWYYLLLLAGNLGRLANWNFLSLPRQWIGRYNPVSTLVAATGTRSDRWPVGMFLFGLLLIALTLVNFRLLRREWSQAADRMAMGSLFQLLFRPKRDRKGEVEAAVALEYGANPLATFEAHFGHRLRVPRWAWITGAIVTACLLLIPSAPAARAIFGMLLWLTCVIAAHNGCAPLASVRDRGGWEELALLPLTARELAHGKLAAGVRTWVYPWGAAFVSLLVAVLRAPTGTTGTMEWAGWCVLAQLLLPPAFAAMGAVIGLLNHASDEAHWRVAVLSTGLPALLLTGYLLRFQLPGVEALCPLYAALSAATTGAVGSAAWIGLFLYSGAGAGSAWLALLRFRHWALRSLPGQ